MVTARVYWMVAWKLKWLTHGWSKMLLDSHWMFTGCVTTMFTLQLNVYTVAISSVNKIVINEWLRLNNSGFLMLLSRNLFCMPTDPGPIPVYYGPGTPIVNSNRSPVIDKLGNPMFQADPVIDRATQATINAQFVWAKNYWLSEPAQRVDGPALRVVESPPPRVATTSSNITSPTTIWQLLLIH